VPDTVPIADLLGSGAVESHSAAAEPKLPLDDAEDVRTLLAGANPRDVLARITLGDPLGMTERCHHRVEARALMLDRSRVLARSLARVAHASRGYDGEPALEPWLLGRIDDAIEDLLVEEQELDGEGLPPTSVEPMHALLSEVLGVEKGLARRCCVVFNSLPTSVRRAFFAVVVRRESLEKHAAESRTMLTQVHRRVKAAIKSMAYLRPEDLREEDGSSDDE